MTDVTYRQTYPVGEQQRVDGLLSEKHAIRLAAQVRELDPHDRVVLRRQHQGAHLEDTLPDLHVRLAPLQPNRHGRVRRPGYIC